MKFEGKSSNQAAMHGAPEDLVYQSESFVFSENFVNKQQIELDSDDDA